MNIFTQVGLWYGLCVVDSVIMKHVAETVPMTTWSRTYYNVRVPSSAGSCCRCCYLWVFRGPREPCDLGL